MSPTSQQIAIEKAKQHGPGASAVRNGTHFGIAGYYALMAARGKGIPVNASLRRELRAMRDELAIKGFAEHPRTSSEAGHATLSQG